MPTGIEHGTITVVVHGQPFEVTTLREDVETFGRHAKVAFGRDWKRDAERRDFTMNALSAARDGAVHDYVGGLADIAARRVRFIGDAAARIAEDYLRILRFFRFHAAYGEGALDPAGLAACIAGRAGLDQLSRERVRAELLKLLLAKRAVPAIAAMTEAGLLDRVLGGVPLLASHAKMGTLEATLGLAPDAMRRLAALAVSVVEDAERLRERLRLTNAESARCASMADGWWQISSRWGERQGRVLLYRLGPGRYTDRVLLAWARSSVGAADRHGIRSQPCLRVGARRFSRSRPRTSSAVALRRGPAPRAPLSRAAEEAWIAAGFPDDRAALAAIANATVAGLPAHSPARNS